MIKNKYQFLINIQELYFPFQRVFSLQNLIIYWLFTYFFNIQQGISIRIHDKDFSLKNEDSLGKRCAVNWDFLDTVLEILPAFFIKLISNSSFYLFLNLVFSAYSITDKILIGQYTKRKTEKYSIYIYTLHFLITLSLLISVLLEKKFPLSLLLICLLPFSFKIAELVYNFQNDLSNFVLSEENPKTIGEFERIDHFLKLLISSTKNTRFETYRLNSDSIILENLLINHQLRCMESNQCIFCSEQKGKNNLIHSLKKGYINFEEAQKQLNFSTTVESALLEFFKYFLFNFSNKSTFLFSFGNHSTTNFIQEILKLKMNVCIQLLKYFVFFDIKYFFKQQKQVESNEVFKQNLLEGTQMSYFLRYFIRNQYQKTLKEGKGLSLQAPTSFFLGYLSYLIQIEKSKILTFIEIVKIKNFSNLSARENSLLSEVVQSAYSGSGEKLLNLHKMKDANDFSQMQSHSQSEYYQAIEFDENLVKIEKNLISILGNKVKILQILSQDSIDLRNFKEKAIFLSRQILNFKNKLFLINQVNPQNTRIHHLIECYQTFFGFDYERKVFQHLKMNGQVIKEIHSSLFDPNTCVLFVSLSQSNFAQIQHSQNSISEIFGFQREEVINRSVNIIIPPLIAKIHDRILQNYVEDNPLRKKQLEDNSYNSQAFQDDTVSLATTQASQGKAKFVLNNHKKFQFFKLALAQNKEGWGVPISFNFVFESIGLKDCGVVSKITQQISDSQYIMTNFKDFKIHLACKRAFDHLFKYFTTQENMKNIYLNRIIPLLPYLETTTINQNNQESKILKTVGFIPKKSGDLGNISINYLYEKMIPGNLEKDLKHYSIEFYNLYSLKLKLSCIRSEHITFNVIEIIHSKKVTSPFSIKQHLIFIKQQLRTLLKVDFNIKQDLNIFKSIKELRDQDNNQDLSNSLALEMERMADFEQAHTPLTPKSYSKLINFKEDFSSDLSVRLDETTPRGKTSSQLRTEECNAQKTNKNLQANIQQNSKAGKKRNTIEEILSQAMTQFSPTQLSQEKIIQEESFQQNQNFDKDFVKKNQSFEVMQAQDTSFKMKPFQQQQQIDFSTYASKPLSPLHNLNDKFSITNRQTQNCLDSDRENQFLLSQGGKSVRSQEDEINLFKLESPKQISSESGVPFFARNQKRGITYSSENSQKDNNKKEQSGIASIVFDLKKDSSVKKSKYWTQNIDNEFSPKSNQVNVNAHISPDGSLQSLNKNNFHKETVNGENFMKKDVISFKHIHLMSSFKKILKTEEQTKKDQFEVLSDQKTSEEKRKEDNQIDINSIKSSQSVLTNQKKKIKEILQSNKKDTTIVFLQAFGFCAILSLSILTFVQFFVILEQQKLGKEDFDLIPWPNSVRVAFVGPITYYSLAELMYFNSFKDNSIYNLTLIHEIQNRGVKYEQQLKKLVSMLTKPGVQDKGFFKYSSTNIQQMVINYDDFITFPVSSRIKSIPANKYAINMTTLYFLENLYFYDHMYSIQDTLLQQEPYYQKQQIDNFINFSLNMTMIQTLIMNESRSTMNDVQFEQEQMLIIVIVVAFVLSIALLPLYCFIQYKNQVILELFATVPSTQITEMINVLFGAIQDNKRDLKAARKRINSQVKLNPTKKKRTFSSTTPLPKFKIEIGVVCLVSFILIIIHPIINNILITQFNEEVQANINLLGSLYNLRAAIESNLAVNYRYLQTFLSPQTPVYYQAYFAKRVVSLDASNKVGMKDLNSVLDANQNKKMKQQSEYDNFFYKIIFSDACTAMQNYPQYILSENFINYDDCSTVFSGIIKQGFQVGIKKLYEIMADLYSLYFNPNPTLRVDNIVKWQKSVNIVEFDSFSQMLVKLLQVIKDFLLITMDEDLKQIQQVQIILLVYQIILLLIFLSIAWQSFLRYVSRETIEIRKLLQLIQIDLILENPYIMSYLYQISK